MDKIKKELQDFANKHKIVLDEHGECGFGRPCVGFLHGDNYIDINPHHSETYKPIWEIDDRLYAPNGVESYHKHDCLCVLVHSEDYNEGLKQLHKWIKYLETQGELEVVDFKTGATGIQAMFTGFMRKALKIK